MSRTDAYLNPGARGRLDLPARPAGSPLDFHRSLPGYAPTALASADGVARRLGVAEVWVKEESDRFGLPAYKVLGASWAIVQALLDRMGGAATRPSLDGLRAESAGSGPTLVAATDGNHGRAVARVARWLGLESDIFLPRAMSESRIAAIRGEGARVHVHPGTYDEAVRAAAASRDEERLLIQDTAWPGYERVPAWIVEGYGTIFREVDAQLKEQGRDAPTLALVQIGVGSLAAAATTHLHRLAERPRIVGVEPRGADCLLRSARAGRSVTVEGPYPSRMAGLNCGTPSATSLPILLKGMDAFVAIPDEFTHEAMRLLAAEGVVAGESGAAGLAGLLAILDTPELADAVGVAADSRILLVVTEADTDPEAYERAVGRPGSEVRTAPTR